MNRLFGNRPKPDEETPLVATADEEMRPQIVQIFALVGEAMAGATHALLSGDRHRLTHQGEDLHDLRAHFLVSGSDERCLFVRLRTVSKEPIHGQRLPLRYSTYLWWRCPDERDRMVGVISAVVGLALGVALTWALMVKRGQSLREDVLRAEAELKVRDSQLAESNERLERQRLDHENSM